MCVCGDLIVEVNKKANYVVRLIKFMLSAANNIHLQLMFEEQILILNNYTELTLMRCN